MGVPAFFRWLSRKYPSIVVHCIEDGKKIVDGVAVPADTSQANPNLVEFDNLYLDMNGIIHPCCHPENKPAPKNEDEMMVLIFEYIDRIFNIVRPRKVLYMAIDGVAPRAKMNQQRSRRFRASKETFEKAEEIGKIREELEVKGADLPALKPKEEHFDSNCITPGTPFMARLADCLHYYIHERLNNDIGWKDIKVILSDANVPGEGEHKIMDYIRHQRASPNHDPNTRHCLCGADADLIMLGLATHEPNFTIIREEFKPNQPRPCEICAQIGHTMKECSGLAREKQGEFDEKAAIACGETEFIFIRLNVLREYLEKDLLMTGLPFPYDFERAVDDWVFMCFFVGNDFLPHLPSLEIREGAIDRLVRLYKDTVHKTGGYLTDSGFVFMERVQLILTSLGEAEDEIFKKRQENELNFKSRQKQRKKRERLMSDRPAWTPGGQFQPMRPGGGGPPVVNPRREAYEMRMQGYHTSPSDGAKNNKDAAKELWEELKKGKQAESSGASGDSRSGEKRKINEVSQDKDPDSEEEPNDEVRLWEDGWKERYYSSKFDVHGDTIKFRTEVARAYVEGLCWVLRYYYQGCASWKWFFPYHYAPFASDFSHLADIKIEFEKHTKPFNPLEQLMSVFPAASKQHIPNPWGCLMENPDSPIIDFYPVDFKVDLNGKKYAWQGVALLPFVDEKRLLVSLEDYYPLLTDYERTRNLLGNDRLYVRKSHDSFDFFVGLYEGGNLDGEIDLDPLLMQGVSGKVSLASNVILPGRTLCCPVQGLDDLEGNQAMVVNYRDPVYADDFIFPAKKLPGAEEPPRVLKPGDYDSRNSSQWRPQVGMARSNQRGSLGMSGHRALGHHVPNYRGRGNQGYNNHQRHDQQQRGDYRRNDSSGYSSPRSYSSQTPNPAIRPYGHNQQQSHNSYQQHGGQNNQSRNYQQQGRRDDRWNSTPPGGNHNRQDQYRPSGPNRSQDPRNRRRPY